MKDTILNSALIVAALSAIVSSFVTDLGQPSPAAPTEARNVVTMEKTVVTAKRLSTEVTLVASAAH